MTQYNFPSHTIDALVDEFIRSRPERALPISVQEGVRAVRTLLRDSPHTDEELASIIAAKAMDQGFAVDFDGAEARSE